MGSIKRSNSSKKKISSKGNNQQGHPKAGKKPFVQRHTTRMIKSTKRSNAHSNHSSSSTHKNLVHNKAINVSNTKDLTSDTVREKLRRQRVKKATEPNYEAAATGLGHGASIGYFSSAFLNFFPTIPGPIGTAVLAIGCVLGFATGLAIREESMPELNEREAISLTEKVWSPMEKHLIALGKKTLKGIRFLDRQVRKFPNSAKNALASLAWGESVGIVITAGLMIARLSTPFTAIPVIAGGVLFLVFGFIRDMELDNPPREVKANENIKPPALQDRQASVVEAPPPKQIAAWKQGVLYVQRKVFRPITGLLPNRLKNSLDRLNIGVSVGGLAFFVVSLAAGPYAPFVMIGIAGAFLIYGFAEDLYHTYHSSLAVIA